MIEPVEEKDRCWRLNYTDEVDFHLDTLPCLPEEEAVIQVIMARGVPAMLAAQAVAITDRRHPQYDQITRLLLSSNPRGFAAWFEEKARPAAVSTMQRLVEARLYASVDATDPNPASFPVEVTQSKLHDVAGTEAEASEQQENRSVTPADGGPQIARGDEALDILFGDVALQ